MLKADKNPEGLYQRGQTWHARLTVKVGRKSQRIRETTGFREADRAKAQAWLRRRITEVEDDLRFGPAPKKPDIPGYATAAATYAERRKRLAENASDKRETHAERRGRRGPLGKGDMARLITLAQYFGETPCDEIEAAEWDNFVATHLCARVVPILRDGKKIGERRVPAASPGNIRRWFAVFRPPLARALRQHRIMLPEFDVPAEGAPATPPFLHLEDEARLLAAYAPHARPIAEMLCWQGCREGEALRLQIKDVDFRAETILFRDTKNGESRTVPMDLRVKRSLRRAIGERKTGAVFLTPSGKAYNDHRVAEYEGGPAGGGIRSAHHTACRGAGIVHFRIHDWRHHFAVWFLIRGGSETALMAICGWKTRSMIDRYVKLPIEHLRKPLGRGTKLAQA